MPPLFSVIIPTYNRPVYLREAVESVLSQTVDDFEVLIINDGGPDITPPTDSRVKVVNRENGGLAAARNTGLEEASGRYVSFLDDDDLYLPRRLEIALMGLERAPIAICLSQGFTDDPGNTEPPKARRLEGDVHDVILDDFTPHAGCTALERGLAPRFDEEYLACEDVEWWLRLSALAPVTTVHEVGYLQRGHAGPRHMNTADARLLYNRRLLDDHADYFAKHRRARRFRYQRIGLRELASGQMRLARRSLLASLREGPTLRSAWHYTRALRPEVVVKQSPDAS